VKIQGELLQSSSHYQKSMKDYALLLTALQVVAAHQQVLNGP